MSKRLACLRGRLIARESNVAVRLAAYHIVHSLYKFDFFFHVNLAHEDFSFIRRIEVRPEPPLGAGLMDQNEHKEFRRQFIGSCHPS